MIRGNEPTRIVAALVVTTALTACAADDLPERSFVGWQRDAIVEMLGEPDEVGVVVKTTESIWGPVEGLWSGMRMGDRLVTWTYRTAQGRKELYFVNDSPQVAAEFFWFDDPEKNPVF